MAPTTPHNALEASLPALATAGNYVWRPEGNRHVARSPGGALVLSFFLKPNVFLAEGLQGQTLE